MTTAIDITKLTPEQLTELRKVFKAEAKTKAYRMNRSDGNGPIGLLWILVAILAPIVASASLPGSPYQTIAERNSFDLGSSVVKRPAVELSQKPLPNVLLTGLTDVGGKSRALIEITESGKPVLKPMLEEGEVLGPVEILRIDVSRGYVILRNGGVETTLRLEPAKLMPGRSLVPVPVPPGTAR